MMLNFAFCKKYETTNGLLPLLLCMNQTQILAVIFRFNTIDPVSKKSNSPLLTTTALQVQYFEETNPADTFSKIKITITAHYGWQFIWIIIITTSCNQSPEFHKFIFTACHEKKNLKPCTGETFILNRKVMLLYQRALALQVNSRSQWELEWCNWDHRPAHGLTARQQILETAN